MSTPIASPTIVKTSDESIVFGFNFADLLATGETISTVDGVTATTPSGASALTFGSPSADDTLVSVRISGGTSGNTYLVSCIVITTLDNTRECLGYLRISR